MVGWWAVVIVLRWISLLWPQTGYIHPDEFFQSVEVVSGDVLHIDVHQSWEFTADKPIRSTLLPCLLYWPAYYLLKLGTGWGVLGDQGLTTTSLLLAPRVIMGILGMCVDVLVYKTLKLYKGYDVDAGMWMYTTSYISLVYYTRTLSNTLEAFLFVTLLYLVQLHLQQMARHNQLNPRSKLTLSSRVKDPKVREPIVPGSCSITHLCILSLVLVTGVFNRPTFVFYLYFPYLYWLCGGCLPHTMTEWIGTCRTLTVKLHQTLLYGMLPVLLFILWDSLYFGSLVKLNTFTVNNWLSDIYDSLTITPLNFVHYNVKPENLAEHGTHSRFTHFFVNIPLLFGPVSICIVFDIVTLVISRGNLGLKRTSSLEMSETKFWTYTLFLPIVLLSLFPHQEPRFLIPLLLPVCVLYSHLIFGQKSRSVFKVLWLLLNVAGFVFYGFLHQGGVVQAIVDIRLRTIHNTQSHAASHVIFSHTYMPPKHLFTIKSPHTCDISTHLFTEDLTHLVNHLKCNEQPVFIDSLKLKLYDLQGRPLEYVEEKIKTISKYMENKEETVYLVAPSSLELELCLNTTPSHFKYIYEASYSWHLTVEDLPSGELWQLTNSRGFPRSLCEQSVISSKHQLHQIFDPLLSLNLYKVVAKDEV